MAFIFRPYAEASPDVTVKWSWFDKDRGLVEWLFKNTANVKKNAVLYRNGYYFGNAFWPVYLENSGFNTQFAVSDGILRDKGTENNSAPLFVADFSGRYIVAFLFSLGPGQKWSILEGGFSRAMEPSGYAAYEVSGIRIEEICAGYAPQQVTDWNRQTGTDMDGYSPNPSTFRSVVGNVNAIFVQLFKDPVRPGQCNAAKEEGL